MQSKPFGWLAAGALLGLAALWAYAGAVTPAGGAPRSVREVVAVGHAEPHATPWSISVAPDADTWAWRTVVTTPLPPTIHGAETQLVTGVDDTRGVQIAFLRFDVASSNIPHNWLHSATLRLTVQSESPREMPRRSAIHRVEEAWEESTLADEQTPAFGPSLWDTAHASGQVMEFEVTELVRGWLQGDPNFGLAVTTTDDLFFTRAFGSRESADGRPELIVWVMPQMTPPTPDARTATPTSSPVRPSPSPTASTTPTPAFLPDLFGFADVGCTPGILVTVTNGGDANAGPFSIASTGGPRPTWRLPGLAAGSSLSLPRQGGSNAPLLIDPANEVVESNEDNNLVPISQPGCRYFLPGLPGGP